jgi:glycolate oxidase
MPDQVTQRASRLRSPSIKPLPPESATLLPMRTAPQPTPEPAWLARLRAALPEDAILLGEAARRTYECDGLPAYRALPRAVVLPTDRAQVEEILAICHAEGVPVVTRGAGTGLSGGALPHPEGVLLVLSRLNRILSVDPVARTARVEPGVRNLAISEAAAMHGLYYAPDPSSQIACSIGGNVAENAGGVHCLKHGLTLHNLLGLEVLTASGEALRLGADTFTEGGADLRALVCGSEGLLGVVVEVTVRLLPQPPAVAVWLAGFDSVDAAAEAVRRIIAEGIVPAGLEMMDHLALTAAEDFAHAGYPRDAAAILLCELDGTEVAVEADCARVKAIFEAVGARSASGARDAATRARFWKGRKSAFPAIGRIAPEYLCMDGTIPRRHLGAVLARIAELSHEYALPVANVFHAGDGNLHPLIAYDSRIEGQLERAEAIGRAILAACVEAGGTVTGEHGVGIEKLDSMCLQFNDGELAVFEAVKRAFDPAGILNPGKAIPTLARCAEHGHSHRRADAPEPLGLARF